MRAVDTNLVVRLIALDDPLQIAVVKGLIKEPFMILPTVVLEAVWASRSIYKVPEADIIARLRLLLGSSNARPISGDAVHWALDRYAEGADFADALHLALAADAQASSFATFDGGIGKIEQPPLEIETLS